VALSTLHHVIDLEWMKEAYRLTRKDGAGLAEPVLEIEKNPREKNPTDRLSLLSFSISLLREAAQRVASNDAVQSYSQFLSSV
jgi:hypothetical protein